MRVLMIFVLMLFASSGNAQTGSTLYESCNEKKHEVLCGAYIRGVAEGIAIGQELGPQGRLCFPENVSNLQLRLVVEKYMRENPAKLNQGTSLIVMLALHESFACK